MTTGDNSQQIRREIQAVTDLRLKNLETTTVKINDEIRSIKTRLSEPPDGLFIRVNNVEKHVDQIDDDVTQTKSSLDRLVEACTKHEARTTMIEAWISDHEKRDDDLKSSMNELTDTLRPLIADYDRRMGIKRWTDKILWAVMAMTIAGVGATIKAVFIDGRASDNARLNRIESLLKR